MTRLPSRPLLTLLLSLLLTLPAAGQPLYAPAGEAGEAWADSVMATLSPDERLGQLIICIADPAYTPEHQEFVRQRLQRYHVGGILFSGGTIAHQARMTNYARTLTRVPLWIALDGEWSLSMRLKDAVRYPRSMALACISTDTPDGGRMPLRDSLLYLYGRETARQCRELGIQINFAPVLDINTNPGNPIIGNRSWGDNAADVISCGLSYASGLEDGGVMAVGKHFPGHGDTDQDSHKTLPRLSHSLARLSRVELAPFREWAKVGYGGVMVAHLDVPALGCQDGQPSSTCPGVIGGMLRDTLGFQGLVFTDGMAMKGVSTYPDAPVKALRAGVDVLLDPVELPAKWKELKAALADGRLTQQLVDQRCRRVLLAKHRLMLDGGDADIATGLSGIAVEQAADRINSDGARRLARLLYARSLVLLKADDALLAAPLADAHLNVVEVKNAKAETYSQVQAAVDRLGSSPYMMVFYTTPYAMRRYAPLIKGARAVLLAHEDSPGARQAVRDALDGNEAVNGRLRVTLPGLFDAGTGHDTRTGGLTWAAPEDVGMDSGKLREIDRLVADALRRNAIPGCQVLVARDGHIVYSKAFGKRSATAGQMATPVDDATLYDLASITKATATVPALMLVMSRYGVQLDDRLSKYIPQLQGTRLWNATVRSALLHETGLPAWYPFQNHLTCSTAARRDDGHPLQVARSLWIKAAQRDTMLATIARLPLKTPGFYLYSDLNFVLLRHLVENVSGQPLDSFVAQNLYEPLHAGLTFNPLQHDIPRSRIAPTEQDDAFRHELIHGTVHDETAALAGGVEGNAGLFGNALGLARVLQMLLDDGEYGGQQLIPADVVRLFTAYDGPRGSRRQRTGGTSRRPVTSIVESHRGLGFDRPNGKEGDQSNVAAACSPSVYGHTGFTGTCFWIDPEERLIYIFLSNRVHPTRKNTTLISQHYRTRIQQAVYDALL